MTSDRRLSVTKNQDGTFTLTGVAYEADRPNINRVVYPKAVLEKALTEYLEKPESDRLLTVGCAPRPKLADAIGIVTGGEMVGNEVRIEAKTLKDSALAAIAAAYGEDFAFAGSGMSDKTEEGDDGVITVCNFEITNMGVVRVEEVTVEEESSESPLEVIDRTVREDIERPEDQAIRALVETAMEEMGLGEDVENS
jgi:hypothetical protein